MRLRLLLALVIAGSSVACQRAATEAGTSVEIISPKDGDTVEQPFEVEFRVSGTDIGPTNTGKDHLHFYVDETSNYVVYESTDPYPAKGLSPGEHRIEVVLAKANHDETETKDGISVTVTGAGGPAESPPPGVGY